MAVSKGLIDHSTVVWKLCKGVTVSTNVDDVLYRKRKTPLQFLFFKMAAHGAAQAFQTFVLSVDNGSKQDDPLCPRSNSK